MYIYISRTEDLNHHGNDKNSGEKSKGNDKPYGRINKIIAFRLHIVFKLVHIHPSLCLNPVYLKIRKKSTISFPS